VRAIRASVRAFVWRLGAVAGFHQNDLELAEEMEFHLQMQIDDNLLAGMTPAEARRLALVKSGGLESAREAYRDRRGFPLLEGLARDFRYALRMLRKNPVFTAAVVITLAVGIGANTALFSLVDAVLLRPLPYPESDRLVVLGSDAARSQGVLVSYAGYEEWKHRTQVFSELATCTRDSPVTLTGGDAPERVDAAQASANLFATLSVVPAIGRGFSEEEANQEQPVAVISYGLWQRWFAGTPEVLGRTLTVDGQATKVIGVMPRSFQFPTSLIQLWRPVNKRARMARSRPFGLLVGRLRPDVSLAQAQSERAPIASQLGGPGAYVIPMRQQIAGKGVRVALWSLFGAVSFVLLIGCANVSNLLLARGMVRQHELAIRAALGASRRRLLGQLMVENAMLCSLAGVAGVLLAYFALQALVAFAPVGTPRLEDVSIDGRVLGFTLMVSCFCTLLFGLLPALEITRGDPQETLRAGGSNPLRRPPGRAEGNALIIGELALAIVLLCGAGLMLRSLFLVHHVPLGFDPRNTLTFRVALPQNWDRAQQAGFYSEALRRIEDLPGVVHAGAISNFSLTFSRGTPIAGCSEAVMLDSASSSLFPTLSVNVVRGRSFTVHDDDSRQPVALVNETLSRSCWPNEDAVGKRFRFDDGPFANEWVTVVGIVADMRRNGMEKDSIAQVFLPLDQWPSHGVDFLVRSTTPASSLAPGLRREMASLDPQVPVFRMSTLEERLSTAQVPRRFETGLLSLFAGVALFLAAVGIYGVMHYSVAQRTKEIGIRMAAGARPVAVLSMILGQGCRLASIGLAAGIGGSLLLSRLFASLPLFGVTATDPPTFAVVVVLLGAVVVVACCVPAWRAASVDPLTALRHE
jgi:predicted permease